MAKYDTYTKKQLKNLGLRFRTIRKAKGYSNYEQFAFQHNINRAQYGAYEKGQNITFASLLRVLKALDVTLDEFFSEGFDSHIGEENTSG